MSIIEKRLPKNGSQALYHNKIYKVKNLNLKEKTATLENHNQKINDVFLDEVIVAKGEFFTKKTEKVLEIGDIFKVLKHPVLEKNHKYKVLELNDYILLKDVETKEKIKLKKLTEKNILIDLYRPLGLTAEERAILFVSRKKANYIFRDQSGNLRGTQEKPEFFEKNVSGKTIKFWDIPKKEKVLDLKEFNKNFDFIQCEKDDVYEINLLLNE